MSGLVNTSIRTSCTAARPPRQRDRTASATASFRPSARPSRVLSRRLAGECHGQIGEIRGGPHVETRSAILHENVFIKARPESELGCRLEGGLGLELGESLLRLTRVTLELFSARSLEQFLGFGQRSLFGCLIPGAVRFRPLEKIHKHEPGQAAAARRLVGYAGSAPEDEN